MDHNVVCLVENMDAYRDGRTEGKRRATWPKVIDLVLRSCHIGTSSVLFGGIILAVPFIRLTQWHLLSITTGSALILFNVFKCRHWPYQGRGLAAAMHIGLLSLIHVRPDLLAPLLGMALVVGVTGSHMPAALRHWSLVHWRRLD
jgi:hypothetical protein